MELDTYNEIDSRIKNIEQLSLHMRDEVADKAMEILEAEHIEVLRSIAWELVYEIDKCRSSLAWETAMLELTNRNFILRGVENATK